MPRTRAYPTELYLCTTIVRQDNDGDPVEADVIVYFDARMTSPGCKAQTYGDPSNCWPAEAPEFELTFSEVEFDGGPPDDAPASLTAIETAQLREWFAQQHRAAFECANDNYFRE
jgi:hypothetical protein